MKLIILFILIITSPVYASNKCLSLLGLDKATLVLVDKYQKDRTGLISQSDPKIEYPEFSCGQICSVNMIQIIRTALGMSEISNPASIINELNTKNPSFRSGLTQKQFTEVLDQLLQENVPRKTDLKYVALELGAINTAINMTKTKVLNRESLEINFNTTQILFYTVINSQGQTIGGHAVILSKISEAIIEIIDPNFPEHLLKMIPTPVSINDEKDTLELIPLERAFVNPRYGNDYRLILFGIATVKLDN